MDNRYEMFLIFYFLFSYEKFIILFCYYIFHIYFIIVYLKSVIGQFLETKTDYRMEVIHTPNNDPTAVFIDNK